MKTEQHSEEETRQLILKIKDELENEGFKTTWQDPFYAWVHGIPLDQQGGSKQDIGDTLYIFDPPVRRIVPFDLAAVRLGIHSDSIYFELFLYYCKELEDLVEADEIEEIFDRHATEWSPKRTEYFADIAIEFSLLWDTEHDEYIEDSLYGNFPYESSDKIISIMRAVKRKFLEW